MFWGLIMEPNKRYSQLVERSFHLSMASLDVTGANDQPVQVMLCYENRNYLLCTLKKGTIFQVPLDLNFQEGTKIAFTCNGFGHVHLTGYLTLDEDLDFGDLEEEEEEEEAPQLVKPKRKAIESPATKVSKKQKKQVNDDEDSSEDDDLDMDAESDSDDEDHTKLVEADEDEDESEDDSDDEDEDDDSEDEPEPEQEVAKSNKQKQKQNQQQAQNQVGKKQEKQKMVNGKDSKQDLSKQKKNKSEQQQQQQNSQQAKKRTVEGGVVVEDLVVGNGAPAKPGKAVSVYYVGRLKNGKKFDETRQGDGFKFQLGKGEVIKGWDVGISGMKIGGKRRLTIPAPMGYGNKGSPPVIPGNSTLIFEVELKKVH